MGREVMASVSRYRGQWFNTQYCQYVVSLSKKFHLHFFIVRRNVANCTFWFLSGFSHATICVMHFIFMCHSAYYLTSVTSSSLLTTRNLLLLQSLKA